MLPSTVLLKRLYKKVWSEMYRYTWHDGRDFVNADACLYTVHIFQMSSSALAFVIMSQWYAYQFNFYRSVIQRIQGGLSSELWNLKIWNSIYGFSTSNHCQARWNAVQLILKMGATISPTTTKSFSFSDFLWKFNGSTITTNLFPPPSHSHTTAHQFL